MSMSLGNCNEYIVMEALADAKRYLSSQIVDGKFQGNDKLKYEWYDALIDGISKQ